MKKAFTLVELSIVLVIIGLLTAGVLGAQSLIASTKRNAYMTELAQINTAMRAFKLEYGQLPGDTNNAWDYWAGNCATTQSECNGDNDKLIEDDELFWKHLTLAGILNGQVQTNYLYYKMGKGDGLWRISNTSAVIFGSAAYSKVYLSYETSVNLPLFNQKDMKYIDEKIDDGNPSSGNLLALTSDSAGVSCTSPHWNSSSFGAATFANLSNTSPACRPWFIINPNSY